MINISLASELKIKKKVWGEWDMLFLYRCDFKLPQKSEADLEIESWSSEAKS